MAVNYGELRSLNAREMISALVRDGFLSIAATGPTRSITILMDGESPLPFTEAKVRSPGKR
jgi:hypothetical protein